MGRACSYCIIAAGKSYNQARTLYEYHTNIHTRDVQDRYTGISVYHISGVDGRGRRWCFVFFLAFSFCGGVLSCDLCLLKHTKPACAESLLYARYTRVIGGAAFRLSTTPFLRDLKSRLRGHTITGTLINNPRVSDLAFRF